MTTKPKRPPAKALTLKDAVETEHARREMERRARDEAERAQHAADLAAAEALEAALCADPAFLQSRGLTADRRRYQVSLDHERFRISAYFDGGQAAVSLTDKRAQAGAAPRRHETAESVADALRLIAQLLIDETR